MKFYPPRSNAYLVLNGVNADGHENSGVPSGEYLMPAEPISAGGAFGCLTGILLALLTCTPASAASSRCEELTKLSLPDVKITSASDVSGGRFAPPGSSTVLETSGFCRVVAVATPTSDSVINFEVWIPPGEQWNQKFLGVGNGGYIGAISYVTLASAVERGFATASTDTGHTGNDPDFAAGHPEKIIDWAWRSVHIMTESAKLIVRDYAGSFPQRSYFTGCSTGGEQALMEAQRFPQDYDGVVAGDPGNNRVHLNAGFVWAFAATHDTNGNVTLPTSKLPLINKAALAACDGLDGIKDGIISEPQACHFNPGLLQCTGAENDECLTAAQVEAVRKVYAGPRNPRTGEQIIAGYLPGSESPVGDDMFGGWKTYITDRKEPMRLGFWQHWVFNDPHWDWRSFDYDRDVAYADTKLAVVNASDPDLSAFSARGGKVLMYSGWAESIGPPGDAIDYHRRVEEAMGGRKKTDSFFRLFMVPGMAHCRGGPGPNVFGALSSIASPPYEIDPQHDALSALERWVETGAPPNNIIAAHLTNGTIDRTRPLCPYPKIARWKGSGSTDDATNFACVEPGNATPYRPGTK